MFSKDIRARMSQSQEKWLTEVLGGIPQPGSGNQPARPLDGRMDHHRSPVAFAWDAKSTLADSITLTKLMWQKVIEQSHGEWPLLPIRFYHSDRLTSHLDLAVISMHDLLELLEYVPTR